MRRLRQYFDGSLRPISVLAALSAVGAALEAVVVVTLVSLASTIASRSPRFDGPHILGYHLRFTVAELFVITGVLAVGRLLVDVLGDYVQAEITSNYEAQQKEKLFEGFVDADWG